MLPIKRVYEVRWRDTSEVEDYFVDLDVPDKIGRKGIFTDEKGTRHDVVFVPTKTGSAR